MVCYHLFVAVKIVAPCLEFVMVNNIKSLACIKEGYLQLRMLSSLASDEAYIISRLAIVGGFMAGEVKMKIIHLFLITSSSL